MMNLSSLLLATAAALCALPPVVAEFENITVDDYKLKGSDYSGIIKDLDKVLPIKSVKQVLAKTNHNNPDSSPGVKHKLSAFTWEDIDGYDDVNTRKWYPQGITTTADATDTGDYEGDIALLVSWHSDHYNDGKRGARISFINMNKGAERAYRNVLLVKPTARGSKPDFEALSGLHAGGIAWYGHFLYVVATTGGLLVFDMRHIYEVDIGDGIGRVGNGYQAYNYRYVLPQVRTYKWQPKEGVKNLHFSAVGLDRTSNPSSLVTGEWFPSGPGRVTHWDLDESSYLLKVDDDDIATASRAVQHSLTNIQGSVTINNKYLLTQSTGSLWTFTWEDGQKEHKNVFSGVPQDVSHQEGYGLWTQMEPPGNRHVVALDLEKF
ncbi:secreted protein [Histoplasma capsulatum G186AR]|nr:secreted protein [Histoplasma capsulatum]QSS69853.1 secreted protein [Histoplasma capsulatum G186AR]